MPRVNARPYHRKHSLNHQGMHIRGRERGEGGGQIATHYLVWATGVLRNWPVPAEKHTNVERLLLPLGRPRNRRALPQLAARRTGHDRLRGVGRHKAAGRGTGGRRWRDSTPCVYLKGRADLGREGGREGGRWKVEGGRSTDLLTTQTPRRKQAAQSDATHRVGTRAGAALCGLSAAAAIIAPRPACGWPPRMLFAASSSTPTPRFEREERERQGWLRRLRPGAGPGPGPRDLGALSLSLSLSLPCLTCCALLAASCSCCQRSGAPSVATLTTCYVDSVHLTTPWFSTHCKEKK